MHAWCLMHAAAKRHKKLNKCIFERRYRRPGKSLKCRTLYRDNHKSLVFEFRYHSTGYEYEKALQVMGNDLKYFKYSYTYLKNVDRKFARNLNKEEKKLRNYETKEEPNKPLINS